MSRQQVTLTRSGTILMQMPALRAPGTRHKTLTGVAREDLTAVRRVI